MQVNADYVKPSLIPLNEYSLGFSNVAKYCILCLYSSINSALANYVSPPGLIFPNCYLLGLLYLLLGFDCFIIVVTYYLLVYLGYLAYLLFFDFLLLLLLLAAFITTFLVVVYSIDFVIQLFNLLY